MITAEGMTRAMQALDGFKLLTVRAGDSAMWFGLVREVLPNATDANLLTAVKNLAATRTRDNGGGWLLPGEFIAEVRKVRAAQVDASERRTRQIGSGGTVTSIDVGRLMQDARNGVPPQEIGRRGRTGHYAKPEAEEA